MNSPNNSIIRQHVQDYHLLIDIEKFCKFTKTTLLILFILLVLKFLWCY